MGRVGGWVGGWLCCTLGSTASSMGGVFVGWSALSLLLLTSPAPACLALARDYIYYYNG